MARNFVAVRVLCGVLAVAPVALFAEGGIPVDALRDDPYFLAGVRDWSDPEPDEEPALEAGIEEAKRREPYTNIQNWPLPPWTAYEPEPQEESAPPVEQPAPAEPAEQAGPDAEAVEPERTASTATAADRRALVLGNMRRLHLDLAYAPYVFTASGDSVSGQLGTGVFQPLSFFARGEYSFLTIGYGAGGVGADFTWSLWGRRLDVSQMMLNTFFALRYKPLEHFGMTFEGGLGLLMLAPKTNLPDGIGSVYPQLFVGIKSEYYIMPLLSVSLDVRFTLPLMFGADQWLPGVQFALGAAVHLF